MDDKKIPHTYSKGLEPECNKHFETVSFGCLLAKQHLADQPEHPTND